MYNYNIKITGSGTAEEIAQKLKSLAEEIEDSAKVENGMQRAFLDGAEWEDETLMTTINVI